MVGEEARNAILTEVLKLRPNGHMADNDEHIQIKHQLQRRTSVATHHQHSSALSCATKSRIASMTAILQHRKKVSRVSESYSYCLTLK